LIVFYLYAAAMTAKRKRWLFLLFFVVMVTTSAPATRSQPFQYKTAQRIVKNRDRVPEYLTPGAIAKDIWTAEGLRGESDTSPSTEQPQELITHKSSIHNYQRPPGPPKDSIIFLQLITDYLISGNLQKRMLEETLPEVEEDQVIYRVKYADHDEKLLATANDNGRLYSISADAPPKPHQNPSRPRSRPLFNPTGW